MVFFFIANHGKMGEIGVKRGLFFGSCRGFGRRRLRRACAANGRMSSFVSFRGDTMTGKRRFTDTGDLNLQVPI